MASKPSDSLVDQIAEELKQTEQGRQTVSAVVDEQRKPGQQEQEQPSKPRPSSRGRGKINELNKELTEEERVFSAKRAAARSAVVRQERGFIRKALLAKLTPDVVDQMLSAVLNQTLKKGDIAAYKAILDTIGESSAQAIQLDLGSDTRAAIANMSMQDKLALIQAVQSQSKGK